LEAYDLYLQAKQLIDSVPLWGREKETNLKAVSLLQEAIQKDSKFALAYCWMAKAHDILYVDGIDRTPERRALGDAAVNKALRLRPELPEVHLAMAFHLYSCYRDFERARVQIAIAAQALSNNSALLELTALIDQRQGRWGNAAAGLERATIADPQNPEVLAYLAWTYGCLRRYRDSDRIWNRLIELDPNQPLFLVSKYQFAFANKADVEGVRAAFEALPLSAKNDPQVACYRVYYAMCARDFAAAEEILSESPNEEIGFDGALVPRQIWALWVEFIRGNHPSIEQFGAAREQLHQKVEADPTDPWLMTALAEADLALGREEESIQEGLRAMELRPVSEDAFDGPTIAAIVAEIFALTNQPDVAFAQLNILAKIPGNFPNYGDLKTSPAWDPLRKDPRFDKLLAELAPRD
jgi:Flp pilus assembly protein TadD